jgi:hypothetical protein
MGDKIIWREHLVMHDFQWDVLVDAAEFEPVIPNDYTRLVVKFPAITEETAIQGLKLSAELLGIYPDLDRFRNFLRSVQSALEKSETPAAMRLKEELKGLSEEDKTQRLSDATLPIRCLVRFYVKLLQFDNKDPVHYAKTVTPKDTDKILLRWKVSDNEYRVIFGDLHAETVTSAKLAELEKLNPQVPLHLAARAGDIERVKLLISKGADVNAKDGRGFTPLHQACFTRLGRAVAELLIAQGANMNAKITDVNDGRTPLHVAAWSGNVPVAELLIAKGVDIDAKENNGGTPLHRACLHSHKVVVELLLAKGADLNVKDNKGQTALSFAKEGKYEEIVELLRKNGAKI